MRLRWRVVLDEFGAQPHPGDRRPQIVADGGQHLGAVVDQSGDPLPHPVERLGHRANFFGAAFGQRRGGAVQAETFGGLGEGRQRRRQGARGPQAEQGDADDREQQRAHPRSAPERTLPLVARHVCRNHRAVRQRDADPARLCRRAAAERSGSCRRAGGAGCAGRSPSGSFIAGAGGRRQAFDVELRKRPRDVGEQPGPLGRRRCAEQLHRRGELAVPAVDGRIGLVRPLDQEGGGDDQMNRDDRGDHQGRDLSADALQVQKAEQLHDQPFAGW